MFQPVRRKVLTVLRYLFPTARDRAYLAEIRDSGLFDRAFYLSSNARLKKLFWIWPERHYVQLGERNGTCPNPGFSPRAYLYHNPDLADEARPFLHYIRTGQAEGRQVIAPVGATGVPQMPDLAQNGPLHPDAPAPVAVALHLYYPEIWDDILPRLRAQTFAFDLYVTLTDRLDTPEGSEARMATRIEADLPGSRVWVLPNHGRDILPFVHLLNAGVFAPYGAVCKLHSKKSPHRADGSDWRQALVTGVLGEPGPTAARLAGFLADPQAGLWVADGHLNTGDSWWGANRDRAEALLARAGLTLPPGPLRFPAGSIYWARAAVLEQLAVLDLTAEDFEPEQALVDGTTPHAIERLMGPLAHLAGRDLCQTSQVQQLPRGLDSAALLGQ